jgi:hypothetical protein
MRPKRRTVSQCKRKMTQIAEKHDLQNKKLSIHHYTQETYIMYKKFSSSMTQQHQQGIKISQEITDAFSDLPLVPLAHFHCHKVF